MRSGRGRPWRTPSGRCPLAALAGFALAYAYSARSGSRVAFAAGLAGQAAALAAFFALDTPDARGWEFVADVGLAAVIPATAAFPLFRTLVRRSPVWLAMTLWHMGRNPLQYTWLVLLLVLVTGLGILPTTVARDPDPEPHGAGPVRGRDGHPGDGQPPVHPRRDAQAG